MIGQLIDGYEVLNEAGRGTHATVYVARQHPVERYVALKVFDRLEARAGDRLRTVLDQLADLDHTNLLPVYASGNTGDQIYAVMRYMPAGTLQAARARRFSLDDIEQMLTQVAAALDYTRQHGLAHGRLTPSNILLDHAGNAFVADCGLAVAVGAPLSDYAAPELRHRPALDLAGAVCADTYSLGAIVYELLTGQRPFEPEHDEGQVNRRLALPALPSTVNTNLTPAIDAAVMTALALDPAQRFQTPLELVQALTQARAAAAASAAAVSADVRRVTARRPGTRDRRGWVFGLIGVLIVIAAAIGLATREPAASPAPIVTSTVDKPTLPAAVVDTPTIAPTQPPTTAPTVPAVAPSASATSQPTTAVITVMPTSSPTPTTAPRFIAPTPTISVTIEPLTLMIPRQADRSTLILTFHTVIRPVDSGPLGLLSLQVPGLAADWTAPILAQVGSGEQTLRVGVDVDCRKVPQPITTNEVIVTLRTATDRVVVSQSFEYLKTWCD